MHDLTRLLHERVASGLRRTSITSCSAWSEMYRIMGQPLPGKWSFKYHPWLRQIHDDESEILVGQKCAQIGYTETALNKAFYNVDILGNNVLYVLPASSPDASDFSSSRFDPALELSEHLSLLFTNVKNVGHKRAGNANLFIRGSRSRSQLKSLPVALLIMDEVDEMPADNVRLAFERLSGQLKKQAFLLSTPTIDNKGINYYFKQSSQHHYYFKCPSCDRSIELRFPESLEITADNFSDAKIMDSYLKCYECNKELPHVSKHEWLQTGKWVPTYTDRSITGYYVNQLYSSMVKPYEIAADYLRSLLTPADEQEFYNSKLGVTHIVEGAKVEDKHLEACTKTYKMYDTYEQPSITTIGIDVGKWLHYEVDEWTINKTLTSDINLLANARILKVGKVKTFEELDQVLYDFKINFGVIDANPERRKAFELANRYYGRIKLCFYGRGVDGKSIHVHDPAEATITVDRTNWLDLSLGRFRREAIQMPIDIPTEYKEHIKALVRRYEKDKEGNPIGRYVKADTSDDHYAHARNYSEIALKFAATLMQSKTINKVI